MRMTLDSGLKISAMVKTGSSYLSQSELPITFGLGGAAKPVSLEITWPTGRTESIPTPSPAEWVTVREGSGVATRMPIERKPR